VPTLLACQTPPPATTSTRRAAALSPVLQRMQSTYPDLAAGRFISLADFESPGQELLFRCVGPDGTEGGRSQPTLSILRSRNETGAGGLKAHLGDATASLRFDGARSTEMALIRDWRPYSLLLMSVFAPPEGATLQFAVESGTRLPAHWSRTLSLKPGWNLHRLDVAIIGDRIDLADVRALSWRLPQATTAADLYFDDILLADNTQSVLGAQAGSGELYAFTRGRRIHVGARDRFELAFHDGLLVAWRSGSDENLADSAGLGPWPVPLAEDWASASSAPVAYDDPALFAAWGTAVAATQRIVEATPFRVIVAGRWVFGDGGASPTGDDSQPEAAPSHSWRYTVYPTGQVYVRVRSVAPPTGWGLPRVGYALAVSGQRDFRPILSAAQHAGDDQPDCVLLARPGGQRADLLWTWPHGLRLARQRDQTSADERRLAVIAGDLDAATVIDTAHLLRVWPTDIDGWPEATGFAADYAKPATIVMHTGRLLTDVPGDLDHDGFNESEGCYEFAANETALRFDFDPAPRLRFDPVFRVHETAGQRAWVYARGRLINTVGRDGDDNLLIWLGHVLSTRTAVEIHVAQDRGYDLERFQ
jgi:hypothetical protein